MPTKTITLDLEAYQRLKSVQRESESFSQTIKRTIPAPFDLAAFGKRLKARPLSDTAVKAVEQCVGHRRVPSGSKR